MKPNILLITVDQMRYDCLHYLNHPVIQTPNLDELARRGVVFTNAYSATPSCVPARAAIITGMSQRNHGRVGYQDKVPWNYEHTMPGEFAKAGYHTQCIGKMHVYPTRNLCGFHNIELHDGYMHYNKDRNSSSALEWWDHTDDYVTWLRERAGYDQDIMDHGLDCNASVVSRPWHLEEKYHPTNWAVTRSIDFLRRRDPSKPFFLWTSFVRPHSPLDPPQYYYDMYKDADLPEPPVGSWADREDLNRNGFITTTGKGIVHDRMRKNALAAYYGLITHIDNQIGRLINSLFEFGVKENTIILFTSDHGDLMGDHNLYQKRLAYEGSAKVPFIVTDFSNKQGLVAGSKVDQPVEMRDIMPSLLDAANVNIPDTVDGLSILPLGRGNTTMQWRDYIHGEHAFEERSYHYVTNGKRKYIWYSQTDIEQYFDLESDPQELNNLIEVEKYKLEIEGWRNSLIRELKGREEGYTDGVQLIVGRPPQAVLSHIL